MAEAITIIGLIGSIINITDAIIETYKVAKDAQKLPDAFAVVYERMPVVQKTLSIIESHYRGDEDESAIRQSLTTCNEKAEDLRFIFEEVCSVEGDSIIRRYRKALKSMKPGRSDRVENLFKDILDTLHTLQAFHVFKNLIPVEDLKAAIEDLVNVDPSLADSTNTTIYSSGVGAMINSGSGELRVKQVNGDGNYQAENIYFQAPAVRGGGPRSPSLADPFYDPALRRKRIDSAIYTPRPAAVRNLESKLKQRARRSGLRHAVLVHGMGGTGKTQLVLQFVEEHKHEYSMVIWIDAESPESFVYSCIRVCKTLQLLDTEYQAGMRQAMIPQRSPPVDEFLTWLERRPETDKWLLVLDNVDDMTWGIKDVLPRGLAGSLIVTSRDAYTARSLGCVSLAIESMEIEEATAFLQIAAFPDLNEKSPELERLCSKVASLLDCLPLAVHLAAATIQTDPLILALDDVEVSDACRAVEAYIERFENNKDHLLMRDDHHFMQSPYPRTVLTTFETTFDKLHGEKRPRWEPPPMRLLTMLAFLEDSEAVSLHKRFQQAYSSIRRGTPALSAYAAAHLPKWLSKILTGESSVDFAHMEQASWDHYGYCETLNTLQRYALIRPHNDGFPEILPLHKIVRWRVQKEGEDEIRMYLKEYTVMLELALSSQAKDLGETLQILNELANHYRDLGQWQYAEECAVGHLQRQIQLFGHCHASTVSSLVRLIEILGEQQLPGEAEREIFRFVKEADDRQALLEILPADLLLLLNNVFLRQPKKEGTPRNGPERLRLGANDSNDVYAGTLARPMPLIGAGQALQRCSWSPGHLTVFQPGLDAPGLEEQLTTQMKRRKQALKSAAGKTPDLVTLFEVLSMGSRDLMSDYMQYIDSDTVRYRDPVGSRTMLHFVAAYGDSRDVQRCIQSGSDVHARDRYGATPLHVAGMSGRSEVFRALIDANGNTNLRDYNGRTPIEYAQGRLDLSPAMLSPAQDNSLRDVIRQHPILDFSTGSLSPVRGFEEMPSNNPLHAYVEDYDDSSDADFAGHNSRGADYGSTKSSFSSASTFSGRKRSRPLDDEVQAQVPHSYYLESEPSPPPSPRLESSDGYSSSVVSLAPEDAISVVFSDYSRSSSRHDDGEASQHVTQAEQQDMRVMTTTGEFSMDRPRISSLLPSQSGISPALVANGDVQVGEGDDDQGQTQREERQSNDSCENGLVAGNNPLALVLWKKGQDTTTQRTLEEEQNSGDSSVGEHHPPGIAGAPTEEGEGILASQIPLGQESSPISETIKRTESKIARYSSEDLQPSAVEEASRDLITHAVSATSAEEPQEPRGDLSYSGARYEAARERKPKNDHDPIVPAHLSTESPRSRRKHGRYPEKRRRRRETAQTRRKDSDDIAPPHTRSHNGHEKRPPATARDESDITHKSHVHRHRRKHRQGRLKEVVTQSTTDSQARKRSKPENRSIFRSLWKLVSGQDEGKMNRRR